MTGTHFSNFIGNFEKRGDGQFPIAPSDGHLFFDTLNNVLWVYNALKKQWVYMQVSSTTSTSSSTTTTSTSTTTTSTSSSTSSSTSTSSTTSTTTTL